MYKKSITRIEKENESSQAELSNPALHDIIATNHVVLAKKPHEERLSRACKAVILMIILGLIAIGIIALTVVLAHSRNALMAVASRSIDGNLSQTPNNTRLLLVKQENLTTITNEPRENEIWQKMTVGLTSYNLPTLTTANVHISSSIMSTEQQNEYTSHHTSSMKSYPSTSTIANEQTTSSTTIQITTAATTTTTTTTTTTGTTSDQPTTDVFSSSLSTTIMLEEEGLVTTAKSQEYLLTSSDAPATSTVVSTSPLVSQATKPTPEETSFTSFISRHFKIQSSTTSTDEETRSTNFMAKYRANLEEDVLDELLFS